MGTRQRQRYHYIDWLRISAFLLLIFYHSARAFFPEDPWHINDPEGSWALRIGMDMIARWRLPLLFFISGIGSWFVLSSRTLPEFLKNRLVKIMVPLLFSMAIIVPPQVWLERLFKGLTDLGYFGWYVKDAFTHGTYSEGNISWHHLWYLAYLFAMTMILLPVIAPYCRGKLKALDRLWKKLLSGPAIVLILLFPLIIENTMGRLFPDKTNALIGDWGWLSITGSWFLTGFLTAPHLPVFTQTASRLRWLTLPVWFALTSIIVLRTGSDDFHFVFGNTNIHYSDMLRIPIAWFAILAIAGFASQLVNQNSAIKRYLNTAVYPLYIIHQTLALTLVFFIVPLDWGVWQKFGVVALGTFALSFAVYHYGIRNLGPLRVLFGLESRRR